MESDDASNSIIMNNIDHNKVSISDDKMFKSNNSRMNKIQKINQTIIDETMTSEDTFDFNDLTLSDTKPEIYISEQDSDTPLSKSLAGNIVYEEDPMGSRFFDRLQNQNDSP
jgi:hypothetical protein